MNESVFNKDDPAINEHKWFITKGKQQYNEETHNIYNKLIKKGKQLLYC